MKQTKFNFNKYSILNDLDEDLKDKLHQYIVINEILSDDLIDVINDISKSKNDITKENKKLLENLKSKTKEFNNSIKKADINLEKKRTGLLDENDKEKIYHFYKSDFFSQNQLGRLFGIAQSTVSRVVNKLNKKFFDEE